LSALENVMLPMVYGGLSVQKRKEQATEVLERVGLGNRLKNRPNELSGGQKQRVAIARAIVNRPVLILADEPTGALDTTTSQEVMNLFSELNQQGLTVILVTHELDVASFTERVILFRDGRVVEDPHVLPMRTAVL
jgi:putative ABC transport system ATP-binding protein